MKLKTRLYLFSTAIIVVTTFSVLIAGMAIIDQVLYAMNKDILSLETSNIIGQIDDAYSILEESGLAGVEVYRESVKRELVDKFSHIRLKVGEVCIYDAEGRKLSRNVNFGFPEFLTKEQRQEREGTIIFYDKPLKEDIFCVYETSTKWGWKIAVSITGEQMFRKRHLYFTTVIFIGLFVLGVTLTSSYFFTRNYSAQISRILQCIEKVAEGNLNARITSKPISKEHAELQMGINSMIDDLKKREEERKQVEEEFGKRQKLESIGILAGGIAHDFNNLLTAIRGNIQLAQLNKLDDETLLCLKDSEKATERAMGLTRQLLTFSKGGTPIKTTASISELLEHSANFVLRGTKCKCEFYFDKNLRPVDIDPSQISQVIDNLVINANQAMPEGGVIYIRAENTNINEKSYLPLPSGQYVKISIIDHGSGIPKQNLSKVFDPFFTTKPSGTGLGLSTCYTILKKHGGYISVESELGVGTVFFVYLPVSGRNMAETVEPVDNRQVHGGKVLVMDDQENIRALLGKMLSLMNCRCEFAEDGSKAIELYIKAMERKDPFNLVFLDLTIPGGLGGKDTIEALTRIDPDITAIVASGYSNDPVMADYQDYGFKGRLGKPFKMEELKALLRKFLNNSDKDANATEQA